jgi:soluble cytochrome b562
MKKESSAKGKKTLGESNLNNELEISCLKTILSLAEAKYRGDVEILLGAVSRAKANGDTKKLDLAKNTAQHWISYFENLDELSKGMSDKDPARKHTQKLVKDQIVFFNEVIADIDKTLHALKLGNLKKNLER